MQLTAMMSVVRLWWWHGWETMLAVRVIPVEDWFEKWKEACNVVQMHDGSGHMVMDLPGVRLPSNIHDSEHEKAAMHGTSLNQMLEQKARAESQENTRTGKTTKTERQGQEFYRCRVKIREETCS